MIQTLEAGIDEHGSVRLAKLVHLDQSHRALVMIMPEEDGGLELTSYVQPGKLFTANEALMIESFGQWTADKLRTILKAVAGLFEQKS